jgi:hypothetical protein
LRGHSVLQWKKAFLLNQASTLFARGLLLGGSPLGHLLLGLFLSGFLLCLAFGYFLFGLTLGYFLLRLAFSDFLFRFLFSLALGYFFLRLTLGNFLFRFLFNLALGDLLLRLTLRNFLLSCAFLRYFFVTFRFLATLRFEAFFRDFFFVAISFLRVGYPALSIRNKIKKSSDLRRKRCAVLERVWSNF